jgi:hypothetical protein
MCSSTMGKRLWAVVGGLEMAGTVKPDEQRLRSEVPMRTAKGQELTDGLGNWMRRGTGGSSGHVAQRRRGSMACCRRGRRHFECCGELRSLVARPCSSGARGGREDGITSKSIFEVEVFFPLKILTSPII